MVIASDYVSTVLLADALRHIEAKAPGLSFELNPSREGMAQELEQGRVDFLVTPAHLVVKDHPQMALFEDTYKVVACANNPELKTGLTLENYQALGHVVYQSDKGVNPWYDQWYVNRYGSTRTQAVITNNFFLMARFIVGTSRIATVQTRLALQFEKMFPVTLHEPPLDAPRLREVLQWHRYRDEDPAVHWVREQMRIVAERLPPL